MPRRLATLLASGALALLATLTIASPAAAVTPAQKLSVLSSWTQTSASSYNAWNSARVNRAPWAEYNFNWSTDYCSSSPDNPLGFTSPGLLPARLRLPQLQGGRPVPRQQVPPRQRLLRGPEARLRHVQRGRPAGLLQPGLDLLPGGQRLRFGSGRPAGRHRPRRPNEGQAEAKPRPANPTPPPPTARKSRFGHRSRFLTQTLDQQS